MNTKSSKLMKRHLQRARIRDASKRRLWRAISIKTCWYNIFVVLPFVIGAMKMERFWKIIMRSGYNKRKTLFKNVIWLKTCKYCLEKQLPAEHGIIQVEENTPTDSTTSRRRFWREISTILHVFENIKFATCIFSV